MSQIMRGSLLSLSAALLLLLPWFDGLAEGEVSAGFKDCLHFFYNKALPSGLEANQYVSDYQPICQRYKNQYHFATLYNKKNKTSLFSAYILSPSDEPRPNDPWMYEPQVGTPAASSRSSASPAASGQPEVAHCTAPAPPSSFSAAPVGDPPDAFGDQPAAPSLPSYDQDVKRWNCSHQQRIWMKTEMESLGLWPGSRPVRHVMNMISLWRYPPQPELIDSIQNLPSPKYFHLHPFFIWKPEHTIMERVRNNYSLPCLYSCTNPHVVSSGVGRPRVVISTTCQYYILASRLSCRGCKKYWFADKPQWIDMLPARLKNIFPAYLTHKKGICRTVMDELRRSGRSPNDMANQLNEALHLKYERAHLSYLSSVKNVLDGEIGLYGQKTITASLRATNTADPFGGYGDADGWFGVTVEAHYLVDCLIQEYRRQEDTLNLLLQGTFGQAFRADHTRKVARKVVLASGTMSSYAVMNENWMILSWVMLQSETDKSLEPMYAGLSSRYISAGQPKATHQWVDRDCCAAFRIPNPEPHEHLLWDSWKTTDAATSCTSTSRVACSQNTIKQDHTTLKTRACFGSQDCCAAFRIPNPEPHEHLLWDSWKTTDAAVAEATSGSLTNSCASRRKYNSEISIKLDLFHCMRRFSRECTSEHHPLYSTFCKFLSAAFCVVDQADLQRLRQAYIFCGIEPPNPTKQHIRDHCRNKIPGPAELVERVESVLQRFYSERDPDGVPLFKPSMLKVWRIQRVHILRGCLSDPEVGEGVLYRHGGTIQLNHVKGEKAAVPVWIPVRGTSQQEGFHFHQARWVTGTQVSTELFQAQGMMGITPVTPLLPAASPRAARKGPIKAGGLIFVLDHSRWTQPMRDKIDQLLQKHHGQKDCLVKVDAEYAVCVQASQKDPNSLLHPTTKHHISRYVKHLAKMKNTKSSLNISPEKLLETQQLWHHLTEGSETVSVPVVTIPPATVNPPTIKLQDAPLTKAQIEQMVKEIVQQQQQQKDQQPMKKRTRNCLACGQPKSRFQGDGSSVHFFYQSAEVKYFYCSQKVYQTYVAEGLSDPRMSFSDFADTPFFARELEAAKRRAAEVRRVMEERGKRKAKEEQPAGRLCRFCHRPLKQGPNSSHVHTGFPGVNGKYIYCPAKVLSLYQSQGMKGEMTWGEFSQSSFYEAEKE
ncbi:PREDICTED: uncharacterized protein LOC107080871, partial [Cyprinodon variegatus]|uniref:uncharacterized protein LOC107080871 n=1 Tax=Cyprinodon variegatus TaxID=28743 RepID=UPI00074273D1